MHSVIEFNTPPLTALLTDESKRKLLALGILRHYSSGQTIHLRGDIKPGLSIVQHGAVKLATTGVDGESRTIAIIGPGQSFGEFTLFADLPRTHDATAVGPTDIIQISSTDFMAFIADEPEILRQMLVHTTRKLHAMIEFTEDLRRLPLDVHLAKILVKMAKATTRETVLTVTQDDLAEMLGVSRVSINKALKSLQCLNLIKRGYGTLTLFNPAALYQWHEAHSPVAPLNSQEGLSQG